MKGTGAAKRLNFVSPNEKAKSKFVAQMVRMARKARLGYDDFLYVSQQALLARHPGLRRRAARDPAETPLLYGGARE